MEALNGGGLGGGTVAAVRGRGRGARLRIEAGAAVLAPDAEVLESAQIDVLVEATGIPEVAARNAWGALRQGQVI